MGREIKRVAANFDWPIDTVWKGYINPHHAAAVKCVNCGGSGGSGASNHYRDLWYGYVAFKPEDTGSRPFPTDHQYIVKLAERNYPDCAHMQMQERKRLANHFNGQRMHHLTQWEADALVKAGRLRDLKNPTAEQVNYWSLYGFGHDSINQWVCCKAYCKRNKMPTQCSACKGHGEIWPSAAAKKKYESWKGYHPPKGKWYQLWSTTSEGSPMTPPFATPEELAHHCVDHAVSSFGSDTATYQQWLDFARGPGWAMSAVMVGGKMISGVEAVTAKETPTHATN